MSPVIPDPTLATRAAASAPEPMESRAFELKFVLDPGTAARVEAWAKQGLSVAAGAGRPTTLLFLDTAGLDVAWRSGDVRRDRFRVRREGEAPTVALERKTRRGDRSRLRSSPVALADLPRLDAANVDLAWPGHFFHRHVIEHGLRPVCRVTYDRVAYEGAGPDGAVRVAFDRAVRGALERSWSPAPIASGADLLEGRVLVEARFAGALPPPLRALVADLRLAPAPLSKYRRCLRAHGVLAPPPGATP